MQTQLLSISKLEGASLTNLNHRSGASGVKSGRTPPPSNTPRVFQVPNFSKFTWTTVLKCGQTCRTLYKMVLLLWSMVNTKRCSSKWGSFPVRNFQVLHLQRDKMESCPNYRLFSADFMSSILRINGMRDRRGGLVISNTYHSSSIPTEQKSTRNNTMDWWLVWGPWWYTWKRATTTWIK
jgi:hypothetical protein